MKKPPKLHRCVLARVSLDGYVDLWIPMCEASGVHGPFFIDSLDDPFPRGEVLSAGHHLASACWVVTGSKAEHRW